MIREQAGVTLVELMISQLLGLLVIGGALAVFAPGVSLFDQTSGAALVQESGRLAMETMASDIEQSGYRGCAPQNRRASVIDASSPVISPRLTGWAFARFRVGGIAADDAGSIDRLLGNGWNSRRFRQGTERYGDVLFVQSVRPGQSILITHDPVNEELVFAGDQRSRLMRGMVIGISDCRQSTILQLDRRSSPTYDSNSDRTIAGYGADSSANCNSTDSDNQQRVWLGGDSNAGCDSSASSSRLEPYRFGSGSQAFGLTSRLYYLSVQEGTDYPSLYRTEMAADGARLNTEVIAEGVENMRLQIGVDDDRDGAPDRYVGGVAPGTENGIDAVDFDAVGIDAVGIDWSNVVSVRLWLLVTSVDQRGHSRFSQPALFPDLGGVLEQCMETAVTASAACPVPGLHRPTRSVFVREISLRNAQS